MVYQRNVNTGMDTQHVNKKNVTVCTEHEAVGGVLQRHSDIVDDSEEDNSDGTDMRVRSQTQHSVAAGMLLNDVRTAIVQTLDIHAVPLWKSLQPCVPPDARRDYTYRQVFAPFRDVHKFDKNSAVGKNEKLNG